MPRTVAELIAEVETRFRSSYIPPGELIEFLKDFLINVDGLPEMTAAQFWANTANKILSTDQYWAAQAEVILTDAATIAVDMGTFINAKVTLAGNRTLGIPSNAKPGQHGFIRIIQDGTGNRTLGYHANWVFAAGSDPTLSTTAADEDILRYTVLTSTKVLGELIADIA